MSAEERAAFAASKEIEKRMKNDSSVEHAKIKLLLLGAGESGKSTIFKQMRVLYGAPLSETEKQQITPIVYLNTIVSMKVLLRQAGIFGYDSNVSSKY